MYLDTDVVLAELKVEDWLAPTVDIDQLETPYTSVITALEVQLVMFDEWSRTRISETSRSITNLGIHILPLSVKAFQAGEDLLARYSRLNAFDAIHLGHALTKDIPIVSTDTLYPSIREIDHIDPRSLF